MTNQQFDQLLILADQAAQKGDWLGTITQLEKARLIDSQHAGVLTGLGTALIQLGRADDALPIFKEVISLAPESPEAHNNLGVVYTITGQYEAAEAAYQETLKLSPEHLMAWKNLAVVYLRQENFQEGLEILAALVKVNPQDNDALLLLAQYYGEGEEYESARVLYMEVLKNEPDNQLAIDALARLPHPEVNQLRIARPEHAAKLAALKGLKMPQRTDVGKRNGRNAEKKFRSVAFFGPPQAAVEMRMRPVIQGLAEDGFKVKVGVTFSRDDLDQYDIFNFSRPHASLELAEALRCCVDAGKQVIVDIDEDFQQIPTNYPGYEQVGPGNPTALSILGEMCTKASLITVPTEILAQRYACFNKQVFVLPPVINLADPIWDKTAPTHRTFNLGFVGLHTTTSDVVFLKDSLKQLLDETPNALLLLGGDLKLYQCFDNISEDRRLFLPAGRLDDYPYMLAYFDLLVFPLCENSYNQARSALPLMEAGARCIPWIAASIPSYREWGEGGVIVEKEAEWCGMLNQLARQDQTLKQLGLAGRRKVEALNLADTLTSWQKAVNL